MNKYGNMRTHIKLMLATITPASQDSWTLANMDKLLLGMEKKIISKLSHQLSVDQHDQI